MVAKRLGCPSLVPGIAKSYSSKAREVSDDVSIIWDFGSSIMMLIVHGVGYIAGLRRSEQAEVVR